MISRRYLLFGFWLAVWLALAGGLISGIHPRNPGETVGGLDALNQGVLAAGLDTLSHDYPATWWGWSQIRATGNLPLWNPSWFSGEAFIASQTFMPFYPPNWLGMLLDFPLAFNIQYPLHLLIAAAVMAWACRRRGLGWLAAGLAGLSWGFGSHLATLAGPGHIQKLQALAWLPLVTLGAWRIGRGKAREGFLPLGLGLALQITAGHLQVVYLTLIVAALEALAGWRATATLGARGWRGYVPVDFRLAMGALAVVFALGLSAIFWIPTAEFAKISNRQGALSWEDATRGSLPPEEALEFVFPRLLGDAMPFGRAYEGTGQPYSSSYVGRYGESSTSSPERVVSDYVGAGVLVFAIYALLARRRGRRAAWGYALLAAAALTLSVGKYLPAVPLPHFGRVPLYAMALKVIPGLAHFRSPSTMMALLAYGLTMAAAIGVNGFLRSVRVSRLNARAEALTPNTHSAFLIPKSALVMLILALIMVLLQVYAGYIETVTTQNLKSLNTPVVDLRAQNIHILHAKALGGTCRGLAQVLALAAIWALLAGMRWRLRRVAGALALAGLVAVWGFDLLGNIQPFWNAADVRPFQQFLRNAWFKDYWMQRARQGDDEPVRYLEIGNELSNRALTLSDFRQFLSIGSIGGYHPVTYGKYTRIQEALGNLNLNFLRLFNVKYLIWPADAGRGWPEGYREVTGINIPPGKLLLYNQDIRYVRQVQQVTPVANTSATLTRLARPELNVYETTSVPPEILDIKHQSKPTFLPETRLEPRIFAQEPGQTRIKMRTQQKGWFVVSEPAAPGWRVNIKNNGQDSEEEPYGVDGFVLAFWLPGGDNDVLLTYDPVSQRLGLFVTLLTLGLAAFGVGWRLAGLSVGKDAR